MTADVIALAERLVAAKVGHSPTSLPSTDVPLTEDEAYEVQSRTVERWCGIRHDHVVGYKVSLTNAQQQAAMIAGGHIYGALFATARLGSPAVVDLHDYNGLLVEPELVFLVDEDMPSQPDRDVILASCRIAAGFELPESRYAGWLEVRDWRLPDVIADNCVAGLFVVGDAVPAASVDLGAITVEVLLDGRRVLEGDSSAVQGNPVTSITWLAAKLAGRGERLQQGMVVASGTLTSPSVARPGSFEANFTGVGRVQVSFR
jgi:2-keto-4-pentenoate hydratase